MFDVAILLAPILNDINWFLVIPGIAIFLLLWWGMVLSFTEAVEKRRAWNLWAAGLIDDEELKRRLGE